MAIKHAFVSGKPAAGDATLVDGPKWDAVHTIEAATITLAHLANLGNQRIIGRNTAGAGVPEEVTASQIVDWLNAVNGSILARFAGAWGAPARVKIDDQGNDLLLVSVTDPIQPGGGRAKVHAQTIAAREMLSVRPGHSFSDIASFQVQPFIGRRHVAVWQPRGAGSVVLPPERGFPPPTNGGTATGRVIANTNLLTSLQRVADVSAAAGGSTAYFYTGNDYFWRGNAAGRGGFHCVFKFAISDAALVATGRTFVGLYAGGAVWADADPSTRVNVVGVGNNNGDANLQLYASGAVAQARTDLGVNFPAQTTNVDIYELHLFSTANGERISYQLNRVNTGHTVTGSITAAAALPDAGMFMGPLFWRSNGGTASAVGIDLIGFYAETDN